MSNETINNKYEDKCKCKEPKAELRDYSEMWHDGEVWCSECNKFIRDWDAG